MRRLVILLVLLLPLQFAFAAGSEYCEFGSPHKSGHLGHHVHKADTGHDKSKPAKSKPASDRDCAFCHLGCAQVPVSTFLLPAILTVESFLMTRFEFPPGIIPPTPDLPPRTALA